MSHDQQPNPRATASQYVERDLAVLRHIDRYGVGLVAAVNRLFTPKTGNVGHILRRLAAEGLLTIAERKIPGNHSYATLTRAGYSKLGKEKTPRVLTTTALDQAISVLYWCVLDSDKIRRFRLSPLQITELFPGGGCAPNVPHVITEEFGVAVVLRVYVAASSKVVAITKNVRQFFEQSRHDQRLSHLITERELGMLVLVNTRERAEQLTVTLDRLNDLAGTRLIVGVGATSATYNALLRRTGGKS
jgi:hypothetical protein